jgi:hypothetical protein
MNITVDIKPEVRAELDRQAAEHGVGVEAYAASLLEEAAHVGTGPRALNHAQLDQTLRDLAQFSAKIPLLFDSAFSRDSLYRDHD